MIKFRAKIIFAAAFSLFTGQLANAQACVDGLNTNACTVAGAVTLAGVLTDGAGYTIDNLGTVSFSTRTFGLDSGITNAGSIGLDVLTSGDNSGVENTATGVINRFVLTDGANSGVTNAGVILSDVRTVGDFSGITNSGDMSQGPLSHVALTNGFGSGIVNSGTMGDAITNGESSAIENSGTIFGFARTQANNSGITNSGTIFLLADTSGDNSAIFNSGTIYNSADTSGVGSSITNEGLLAAGARTYGDQSSIFNAGQSQGNLQTAGLDSRIDNALGGLVAGGVFTTGANSDINNAGSILGTALIYGSGGTITNSGFIGANARTDGANSSIVNTGTITGIANLTGNNSTLTNSGTISTGVFMLGADSTLNLQRGSIIEGVISFGALGGSTLTVERGMNLRYVLLDGQPDLLDTVSPAFQVGNLLMVVDPSGYAAPSVMLTDVTTAIGNAMDARESAGRTRGFARHQSDGFQVWARFIGGGGLTAGDGAMTDISSQYYGAIAGIDSGAFGAFIGISNSQSRTEFDTYSATMGGLFGGVNWRPHIGRFDLDLALTGGTTRNNLTTNIANNLTPGGMEQALGAYNGWFISPSATLSTPLSFSNFDTIGRVKVSYTALFLDEYTETGVIAPLTIPARVNQQIGLQSDLTFPLIIEHESGAETRAEWHAGLAAQVNFGATTDMAGFTTSMDVNAPDSVSGVIGASYGWVSANGRGKLALSTEAQISLAGGYSYSTGLRASWAF